MIIGLTGGIGSGKSAAAALFKDIGVDLIDADDLARDSLSINSEGYKLFIEEFGDKYLDENKNINRELIRKLIFNDSDAKSKLESIIHPIVRSGIETFIKNKKSDYCIIVVPLIFETNSSKIYDRVLVIDCDVDVQISRTSKRDNQTKSDIENIVNKQATREQRLSIADEVIVNNGSLDLLRNEVLKIHKKYLEIVKNG
ncbi:MAG: dephospho-CoA kinase [Proteobacteria bacterium]|jgi:dephospho-CoA kinase|nr:dephospho-CoA kinase [Pseudomonadota bacterium]NCW38070.1 dephospho-CoA kinase [Pseudomonadota bacterium]NCX42218.1 dephospho-CoA kinase [Pseudomonadota bacterium]NCX74854.1 dephospho-CoA kinase [Pseudomonadota bacterium]NDE95350.1 dephospho-CoA kinase [Pseudomonadota bacterium]